MNWIRDFVPPRFKGIWRTPTDNTKQRWVKCPKTDKLILHDELKDNLFVFPSGYHMQVTATQRMAMLLDDSAYEPLAAVDVPLDPLKFRDKRRYTERLKEARSKTGLHDSIMAATGLLNTIPIVAVVQDFAFMGGSLGMAAGETFIHAVERAINDKCPLILFSASGGARMQEGIFSLMQMPRTTVAVGRLNAACLPYIVVLTNPTTGGVTASYAMLGDIHIAEPEALIAFSGPRVIEQTIREVLPEGFQRAEYLHARGMIDMIVARAQQRSIITRLIRALMRKKPRSEENTANAAIVAAQPQQSDATPATTS